MMNAVRIICTILLIQVLAGIVFLHVISGTWEFSVNRNPSTEPGGDERQFYLQGINETGTLLVGWRSQPKISEASLPTFSATLKSPPLIPAADAPASAAGSPRKYTVGVFLQSYNRPEQRFQAHYLYLRIWLLEVVGGLLLAGIWTPALIRYQVVGPATPL